MKQLSSTFKVQYDLRPAKQVERRMLLDAFQRLGEAGFQIRDYQYTGFGSVYFVDFILFHKMLGLHRLLSLEHEPILESRVRFNKPFSCVDIKMQPAAVEIPNLSRDLKHILWLDYDGILRKEFIADLKSALNILPAGSIVLITVDAEPPRAEDFVDINAEYSSGKEVLGPKHWKEYFEHHASEYLPLGQKTDSFTQSNLATVSIAILREAFKRSILYRRDVSLQPLFNFTYRDGHLMVTMGVMVAAPEDKRRLNGSTLTEASYFRANFDSPPFEIRVPRLTRKERVYMDFAMPCAAGWKPTDFELDDATIDAYREVYRFLPAFAELLL
ncbi:MAG TPA: O-methyltransferase [Candidatus Angelobacter sp.]|jgi:hypothetical protein|nr:O-methyltransferase [Candidatus Angelobacter sp.]